MSTIDLLSFNIKGAFEGEKFQTALSWLPKEEHGSVLRFKYDRDQHLALANLLLRRHYFSELLNVGWYNLEFDRLVGGKPILKNYDFKNIDYNTSHEGNWVIFGATRDMKIGIDAVSIDRPKTGSIDAFIKSFHSQLTHNEMHLIMDSEDEDTRLTTFYELWGCKESYTKALGVGLSLDLKKLDFRNEQQMIKMNFEGKTLESWCYHLSYLDETTLAVICCGYESSDRKLDSSIEAFVQSTKLLGKKPLHIMTKEKVFFYQVKYEDIKNNKWMSRN